MARIKSLPAPHGDPQMAADFSINRSACLLPGEPDIEATSPNDRSWPRSCLRRCTTAVPTTTGWWTSARP